MGKIKVQMNTGCYEGEPIDRNIAATLIKVWFRELPTNVLNAVDKPLIDHIAALDVMAGGADLAAQVFADLKASCAEPRYSLLLWLLDIMAHVVRFHEVNKMTVKKMNLRRANFVYSQKRMFQKIRKRMRRNL